MFIQSHGKGKNEEDIVFIAFSPNDLLERMIKEEIETCTISYDEIDSGVIAFKTVSREDVKNWIEKGVL